MDFNLTIKINNKLPQDIKHKIYTYFKLFFEHKKFKLINTIKNKIIINTLLKPFIPFIPLRQMCETSRNTTKKRK